MSRLEEIRKEVIELENTVKLKEEAIAEIEGDTPRSKMGLDKMMKVNEIYKTLHYERERLIYLKRFI